MSEILPIILSVLKNKYVILAAIVCFLLMDFASYVCRYRKKPPKQKIKKTAAKSAPPPQENDEGEGEGDAEDE